MLTLFIHSLSLNFFKLLLMGDVIYKLLGVNKSNKGHNELGSKAV